MNETIYEWDADERLYKPRKVRAISFADDGDHPLLHLNDGSDYRYDDEGNLVAICSVTGRRD